MSFNNEENNNILQQQREFLVRLHQATLGELEKILNRIQTNISTPNILNSQFLQRIYIDTPQFKNYCAQSLADKHIDYYKSICNLLQRKKSPFQLVRIGSPHDGGYIMADIFAKNKGIAYSLGITDDVSWDEGMAQRGYDIYMYDPTIDTLPKEHEKFHFFKQGIGKNSDMITLDEAITCNGHVSHEGMILKMDIEGFEYETLYHIQDSILAKFSQLIIEFHDVLDLTNSLLIPVLEKINKNFQYIHIHGQDVYPRVRIDDKILPNYIEVTYLNKFLCSFSDDVDPLPLDVDMPTYAGRREIYLGKF